MAAKEDPKPCPTCGTCPTCGHRPSVTVLPPPIIIQPQPTWPRYPQITYGQTYTNGVPINTISTNNIPIEYQTIAAGGNRSVG